MTFSNKDHSPEESLEKSLKEMNLMHKGKLKKVTWEEFKKTLERDKKLEGGESY